MLRLLRLLRLLRQAQQPKAQQPKAQQPKDQQPAHQPVIERSRNECCFDCFDKLSNRLTCTRAACAPTIIYFQIFSETIAPVPKRSMTNPAMKYAESFSLRKMTAKSDATAGLSMKIREELTGEYFLIVARNVT